LAGGPDDARDAAAPGDALPVDPAQRQVARQVDNEVTGTERTATQCRTCDLALRSLLAARDSFSNGRFQ
jgi:hypothetical protein